MASSAMIGIFDSGSGGLTVLAALRLRAPLLDVVYFADLANMPYGSRTQADIQRLTTSAFALLKAEGATQLVSACNSVSAAAVRPLLSLFAMPGDGGVIEMVGPAVRHVSARGFTRIAVVATPATVESGMYQTEFASRGLDAHLIACPDLASYIEHGDSVRARDAISVVVDAVVSVGADALMLGCTHYPFERGVFEELIALRGAAITVIDPAEAVADEIVRACGFEGVGALKVITSARSDLFDRRVQALIHH